MAEFSARMTLFCFWHSSAGLNRDFGLFLLEIKNSIGSGRKLKISGRNPAEKFLARQSAGREFLDFVLETKEVPKMYI